MKYFFDNCVSYRIAAMLRALDVDVIALREEYPVDTDDVPLFSIVASQDRVFVSTDTSQLTREHEARALKQAGITAIYFGRFYERMKLWDQAVWVLTKWRKIDDFAQNATKGTAAEIRQNGSPMIYPM